MNPQVNISLEEFFSVLVPDGFIECRAIKLATKQVQGRTFTSADKVSSIQSFLTRYSGIDLYFGVVSRLTMQDGRTEGCGNASALFVDIDFKEFAGGSCAAGAFEFRTSTEHRCSQRWWTSLLLASARTFRRSVL